MMITAPSTIRPKSNAPRLIRLPETPPRTMPKTVKSIANGITAAVISDALKFPSSRNSTTMTSRAPSTRFLDTVAMVRSTSAVRSYTGLAETPGGRLRLASWRRAASYGMYGEDGRQASGRVLYLCGSFLRDLATIGTKLYHRSDEHDFAPFLGRRAAAQLRALADRGDVAHTDRHADAAIEHGL